MKMKTALSIAGSDCSGGAGIQADLKTMTVNGVYAMSVITALTAQNTTGVRSILESTPDFLLDQLDAVFQDIRPDAVKIGMVSSARLIARFAPQERKQSLASSRFGASLISTMFPSAGISVPYFRVRYRAVRFCSRISPPVPSVTEWKTSTAIRFS